MESNADLPITGMITWIFNDLSLASKVNPLPIAVLKEAHNFILISPTGSLLLDDEYLGDINNDVSSLYVERIDRITNVRFVAESCRGNKDSKLT